MTSSNISSLSSAPSSVDHPMSAIGSTSTRAGKATVTPGKTPGQFQTGRRQIPLRRSTKVANYVEGNSMHYNNPNRLADVDFEIEDGFDKLAASWFTDTVRGSLPTVVGTLGTVAALGGINSMIAARKKRQLNQRAEIALQKAIQSSPKLQGFGYETLKQYMPMIIKASPTIAEEPLLLANYLESMLDAEGHMNLATFAELAGIEGTVLRNEDYRHGARNKMMEGVGKGMVDIGTKAFGNFASAKGLFGKTDKPFDPTTLSTNQVGDWMKAHSRQDLSNAYRHAFPQGRPTQTQP